MDDYHQPVLLKEAVDFLNVLKGSWYIDATLGGGGHSEQILKKGGKIIGIDQDLSAIKHAADKFKLEIKNSPGPIKAYSDNLILVHHNFSHLKQIVMQTGQKKIGGVLMDLGVSSYQLDEPGRGFSFNKDALLDMRMDQSFGATAKDLVNGLYEKELTNIFQKYSGEKNAFKIAKKIVETRKYKKIETTKQLADLISKISFSKEKIHPATRVFQALRIVVNDELASLEKALPKALDILQPGGRIVVISFHSLEDRIVKNFFRDEAQKNNLKIITEKPIETTLSEVDKNPRSRSAKLRAAQKI